MALWCRACPGSRAVRALDPLAFGLLPRSRPQSREPHSSAPTLTGEKKMQTSGKIPDTNLRLGIIAFAFLIAVGSSSASATRAEFAAAPKSVSPGPAASSVVRTEAQAMDAYGTLP